MENNTIKLCSRFRGSISIDVKDSDSFQENIKAGITKLGFSSEDVHLIFEGKVLTLDDEQKVVPMFDSSSPPPQIHLIHKCSTETMVQFRYSSKGSSSQQTISMKTCQTVLELKKELLKSGRLELAGNRVITSVQSMKLILKGKTLDSNELIGEYTGSQVIKPLPLLIMFSPDGLLGSQSDEVEVEVKLPNKKTISFDVRPNTSIIGVKMILHHHFNAPSPESFELFSACSRQPIMNQVSDSKHIEKVLKKTNSFMKKDLTTKEDKEVVKKDSKINNKKNVVIDKDHQKKVSEDDGVMRIADVMMSVPYTKGNVNKLSLLLVPTCSMNVNNINFLITTFQMLNTAFPTTPPSSSSSSSAKQQKKLKSENSSSSSVKNPTTTSVGTLDSNIAPRPSRPAAHPKERKSKSRKGFAGLKRGFFTPEKKKKKPAAVKLNIEDIPSTEKVAAAIVDNPLKPTKLDFETAGSDLQNQQPDSSPPILKSVQSKGGGSRRLRCQVCAKKLLPWDLAAGECRCGGVFCSRHGHFAAHNCAFDFASAEKEVLRSRFPSGLELSNRNYDAI